MKLALRTAMLLACALPSQVVAAPPVTPPPVPVASASADPSVPGLLVPAGTAVTVHVVGTVSSGSAKVGDTFQIQAADDVIVGNMIVVQKGAGGAGHIIDTDSAGGNGHSGKVSLAFDYVYSVDGGRIKLSDAPQQQTEEDRKGASSTATIIGFATFGLGGLFAHNFAHGRQKTIDEKTIMSAFVADNVHVQTTETAIPVKVDH